MLILPSEVSSLNIITDKGVFVVVYFTNYQLALIIECEIAKYFGANLISLIRLNISVESYISGNPENILAVVDATIESEKDVILL